MEDFLFAFLSAILISFLAIPSIIRVAKVKNLMDVPDHRKQHEEVIPTLGGMAIFASFTLSASYWVNSSLMPELQYVVCALVLMFFTGIKDDILTIAPEKKFAAQVFAAWILVHSAGIKLTSLYGIMGIYEVPIWFSYLLSIIAITGITNAFNLIDGVNLLAASTGVLVSTVFGLWFAVYEHPQWAVFSFSLAGSLLGFMWFNKSPAKIFMGDTGALIIGIICSVLAIKFVELNRSLKYVTSAPTLAIAILITPIFDTARVFSLRLIKKKSPFSADRNHMHHLLIDNGLSHHSATAVLLILNFVTVVLVYYFRDFGGLGVGDFKAELLLILIFVFYSIFTFVMSRRAVRK